MFFVIFIGKNIRLAEKRMSTNTKFIIKEKIDFQAQKNLPKKNERFKF